MSHLLRSLRRPFAFWFASRRRPLTRHAPMVKPAIELLEERCVLTSPSIQTGGVLTTGANLTHLYNFSGSLTDQYGGPTLVDTPATPTGTVSGGRYIFPRNAGLQLSGGLASTSNYSIELVMRYDALGGSTPAFKKFIDFANLTVDAGMYVRHNASNTDNVLLSPGGAGTGVVSAGVDFHFVIARN